MKFKTQNEETEWPLLYNYNIRLYTLIQLLEGYAQLNFNKELTLTEIYRTQEEFDALYAQTPPDKRPARSPHQDWRAVDIRSSDFTEQEIHKMLTFLNTFTYAGGQRPVAIYHMIAGNTFHFHTQYN